MTAVPPTDQPAADRPPRRRRRLAVAAAGVLAAAGLSSGLALSLGGSGQASTSTTAASYGYYQSVIGRYGPGSMMGAGGYGPAGVSSYGPAGVSGYGWMMGRAGYAWMMGGVAAPQWMRGRQLPPFMLGAGDDPGSVMGRLFADAPGPRVRAAEAERLGDAVPAGASVDKGANRLVFSSGMVSFSVVASPSMPAENFRIAGMTNPTVVVPEGARVDIELVNADSDMAHGLVVTKAGTSSSWMPMMTAAPVFAGAALWFLGEPTSAGMHTGTLGFTASAPGSYEYLCPVPGHAEEGMAGSFVVEGA